MIQIDMQMPGARIAGITTEKPEDAPCSMFMDVLKLGSALTGYGENKVRPAPIMPGREGSCIHY